MVGFVLVWQNLQHKELTLTRVNDLLGILSGKVKLHLDQWFDLERHIIKLHLRLVRYKPKNHVECGSRGSNNTKLIHLRLDNIVNKTRIYAKKV